MSTEMWPPNGGQESVHVHDSQVANMQAKGWTFEAQRPKRPATRVTPRTSATTRATSATTDKPEQKQGTGDKKDA